MENEKAKELEALKALYDFRINEMKEKLFKENVSLTEFGSYCSLFEKGLALGVITDPLSCVASLFNASVIMLYEDDDRIFDTLRGRLEKIIIKLYSEKLENIKNKLNAVNASSETIYPSKLYSTIDDLTLAIMFHVNGVDYVSLIEKLKNVDVRPTTYEEHRKMRDAQMSLRNLEIRIKRNENNSRKI